MKAFLISVTHSSSMYWSIVSALPVTTYPPIIVRQLGHHSLKQLRPVALRPNLSKGLPLSIKKYKKMKIHINFTTYSGKFSKGFKIL